MLLMASMAKSTKTCYTRAWELFGMCMVALNLTFRGILDLPLHHSKILLFIGFLHMHGYSSSTITTYVCALGYIHRIKGFVNPTTMLIVQKTLAAVNKLNPSVDSRLPITLPILEQLNIALCHTVSCPYNRVLLQAMNTTAFYGLMRIGEITRDTEGGISLMLSNITIFHNHIVLKITKFKYNLKRQPFDIVLCRKPQLSICPFTSLINYLKCRGLQPGPLFCFPNMQPISREFFISNLNMNLTFCGLNVKFYKSHSYRIGGASYYASMGMSDEELRLLGRWKGDTFKRYIRCERILSAVNR